MEEYIEELRKEIAELKETVKEYEDLVKELRIDLDARDKTLSKIKEEVEWVL